MPSLRAAIFDVDGVLVNSPHERAWREALKGFADPAGFTTAFYQANVAGRPRLEGARAVLERLGGPEAARRSTDYADKKQALIDRLIEVDSLHGTLEVVKRSDWVTLLSITSILRELDRGELAARRTDPPVDLEFYLIHPARRALSAAAALFVERLEQAFCVSQAEWAHLVADETVSATIR